MPYYYDAPDISTLTNEELHKLRKELEEEITHSTCFEKQLTYFLIIQKVWGLTEAEARRHLNSLRSQKGRSKYKAKKNEVE